MEWSGVGWGVGALRGAIIYLPELTQVVCRAWRGGWWQPWLARERLAVAQKHSSVLNGAFPF